MLLLDELTGKVHKYNGVSLSGAMLCDCPLVEKSYAANKMTAINQEYLEEGIWRKAECLKEEEEYDFVCPECNAHTCLVVSYIEDEVKECSHCGYGKSDDVLERMREMREENEDVYQEMGEM